MNTYAYYLHFRTPLHIGERGVGQEETRPFVPADTLFSAICSVWRLLYGVDSLVRELLVRYSDSGREPFWLTSAFPFAGETRLYPKPLRPPNDEAEFAKRWKSIRWISETALERYLKGEAIALEADYDLRWGDQRLLLQDGTVLISPEEYAQVARYWDYERDDLCLYRDAVVPRVTLDRITNASQIWQFGEVHFAPGCGLWFGVQFADSSVQERFEACLRLLGDSGLGGERGAGRGLFTYERREWRISEPTGANAFMTLSPWLPADAQQRSWLRADGSAYELVPKRGWISSPEARNLRRKEVWMVAEGSVIAHPPEFRLGQLANVAPDIAPHPIYRYGYAYPLGVKQS